MDINLQYWCVYKWTKWNENKNYIRSCHSILNTKTQPEAFIDYSTHNTSLYTFVYIIKIWMLLIHTFSQQTLSVQMMIFSIQKHLWSYHFCLSLRSKGFNCSLYCYIMCQSGRFVLLDLFIIYVNTTQLKITFMSYIHSFMTTKNN